MDFILMTRRENLIVGSWGAVMEGWGTPELKGSLKSINLHTKQIKSLEKTNWESRWH